MEFLGEVQALADMYGGSCQYPYSTFQQINLDFVLKALVEIGETVEAIKNNEYTNAFTLVGDYAVDDRTTTMNIVVPLSKHCKEIMITAYVPQGTSQTSVYVRCRMGDSSMPAVTISNFINATTTPRWWFGHAYAFGLYPTLEYMTTPAAGTSTGTMSGIAHSQYTTEQERYYDNVQFARASGSAYFPTGTIIKIYGR